MAKALAGQVEGATPRGSSAVAGGERVCTLPSVLNAWALGQFHPWHQSSAPPAWETGQRLFQGHQKPLGSSRLLWLAGLSALRSGLFWELRSQNTPLLPVQGPVVADDDILSRNRLTDVSASGNLPPLSPSELSGLCLLHCGCPGPGSPCRGQSAIPTLINCGFPNGGGGLGSRTLFTSSVVLLAEH